MLITITFFQIITHLGNINPHFFVEVKQKLKEKEKICNPLLIKLKTQECQNVYSNMALRSVLHLKVFSLLFTPYFLLTAYLSHPKKFHYCYRLI